MPKAKFLALALFFTIIIILLTLKVSAEEEKTDLFAKETSKEEEFIITLLQTQEHILAK